LTQKCPLLQKPGKEGRNSDLANKVDVMLCSLVHRQLENKQQVPPKL
jgi:hypothetical protein